MRWFVFWALLLGANVFGENLASGFPDGHYAGVGSWWDNLDGSGSYTAMVHFKENEMYADYQWEAHVLSTHLAFRFQGEGSFEVMHRGDLVGYGDCLENRCVYEIAMDEIIYRETVFLDAGELKKIGYKKTGDRIARWEEVLYRLDSEPDAGAGLPAVEPVKDRGLAHAQIPLRDAAKKNPTILPCLPTGRIPQLCMPWFDLPYLFPVVP